MTFSERVKAMKSSCAPVILLAFLCLLCRTASAQEHLEPGDEGIFSSSNSHFAYLTIVRRFLLMGQSPSEAPLNAPSDGPVAYMLCLSLRPEWAVTLWKSEKGEFRVEVAEVIGDWLWGRKRPERVKVRRTRAAIDSKAAAAVHEAWLLALRDARPRQSDDFIADGTTYRFGAEDAKGNLLAGKVRMAHKGTRTRELVQLGELLRDYAKAAPAQRTKIAESLTMQAMALKAKYALLPGP